MPDLTDDEFTLLMIADNGESLAPIGRWKQSILALTARGLLQRNNEVNYGITLAGKEARAARDHEDAAAMLRVLGRDPPAIEARKELPSSDSEGLKDG
ncbi:MAG: hypothetical protein WC829_01165 [Hyphomicrobium sp.]|jgi:hypothetical protein